MCRNVQPCKEQVVIQIANQVKILNKTAQDLFDLYVSFCGYIFRVLNMFYSLRQQGQEPQQLLKITKHTLFCNATNYNVFCVS